MERPILPVGSKCFVLKVNMQKSLANHILCKTFILNQSLVLFVGELPYISLYTFEKCERFLKPTSKHISVTFCLPDRMRAWAASNLRRIIHFWGRQVAYLLEITLERGKATPRVIAHAVVEVHRQKDVRITQRIDSVQIICFHDFCKFIILCKSNGLF